MVKIVEGIPVWGDPDPSAVEQIKRCVAEEHAAGGALMADHHKGYSQPIGGVVAYRDAISPSGVGYDIGCGNKAARTPLREAEVRPEIGRIMNEIQRSIPFGVGRAQAVKQEHDLFDDPTWRDVRPLGALKQLAQQQLGTVGSGNHYVDLFVDEDGFVWVGVHFGSRGFGHKTASGFLNLAAGRGFGDKAPGESMDQPPTVLPLGSTVGQDYLAAMQLAGRYAHAGRDAVVDQVLAILGTQAEEEVHNHHNFAWVEEHGGEQLVVVRKGATPNLPGQRSFVGGSMGDISVILEGVESPENEIALRSTVHGAGRVMSRRRAAGKFDWKTRRHTGGEITREMMLEWIGKLGVELRGAGTDESPHVYKRLPDVVAAHANTVRVVHTLRPIGVAMAGEDVVDPYKD
jgi:tRNA-splicing ligase RtcB (3'-phosphate/5'-hydroxy nucleic acid ligase)